MADDAALESEHDEDTPEDKDSKPEDDTPEVEEEERYGAEKVRLA